MGLYVQTYAKLPRKKLFQKLIEDRLVAAAKEWVEQIGLKGFFKLYEKTASKVMFDFYPLNERLIFEIDNQNISFGIKTSTAGAGYHVRIIELLDWLETKLNLKWEWQLSGGESGDETNYAISRDFDNLRAQHFEQIIGIMNHVLSEMASYDSLLIYVKPDLNIDFSGMAGPKGFVEKGLLDRFATDDRDAIVELWQEFTLWDVPEIDDNFWISTLTGLLWTEYRWREAFENAHDAYINSLIKICLNKISKENLPQKIKDAVSEFELTQTDEISPETQGVGYYKRDLTTHIFVNWKIKTPGYFYTHDENDGQTVVFHFDNTEIRSTSLTVGTNVNEFTWPQDYSDSETINSDKYSYRINRELETDKRQVFHASAFAVAKRNDGNLAVLMVTVTTTNEETALPTLQDYMKNRYIFVEQEG